MKVEKVIKKLKNENSEEIIVKRYSSGEFIIKYIPSWRKDRPDTSYISPEAFKLMLKITSFNIRGGEE